MKILKSFKKKDDSFSFADIPLAERKKIVKEAVERANKEQYSIVKAYRASRCATHN